MSGSANGSKSGSEPASPGSTSEHLLNRFTHGLRVIDGVRYLIQGKEVQNAFGLQTPELMLGNGKPPHAFQVPHRIAELPEYADDPLFKALAPGVDPGAFMVHMDRPELLFTWMTMYGGPLPSHVWCWGVNKLTLSNRALFQTNFVPLILVGLEMSQLAEAINIVHMTKRAGRRLVIAARPNIPRVIGTTMIQTQLGEAPPPSELVPLGNHLATLCLTQM